MEVEPKAQGHLIMYPYLKRQVVQAIPTRGRGTAHIQRTIRTVVQWTPSKVAGGGGIAQRTGGPKSHATPDLAAHRNSADGPDGRWHKLGGARVKRTRIRFEA